MAFAWLKEILKLSRYFTKTNPIFAHGTHGLSCTNWRAGHLYIQMQKYWCSFPGCISIFLVGEVPNPLEDPYLEIRGCTFVPN